MKAVITGATKGIGRALAIAFAREGFDLAICARTAPHLDAFAEELRRDFPSIQVLTRPTDMGVREQVQAFAAMVTEQWGAVDLLINNAGVFLSGRVSDGPEDGHFEEMMNVNFFSTWYLTRALLPPMLAKGEGHIINICSIASFMPYGSYGVTKAAQLAFSRVLREEVKDKGIRVTAIMPGSTLTDSWSGTTLPEERFMTAEDVAESVLSCWKMSKHTVVEEMILRPQLGDI